MRGDGYDALVQRVKEDRQGHDIGNDTALRRDCERARTAYHHWGRINLPLYIALGFTVLDIALCFVALPYVPKINRSQCGTSVILAFAVALGIICLGLYIWLIVSMVKRPPTEPYGFGRGFVWGWASIVTRAASSWQGWQ